MEIFSNRLATFRTAQQQQLHRGRRRRSPVAAFATEDESDLAWPHVKPTPEELTSPPPATRQLADAGFYHAPTALSPDNTACFLCQRALDGWEEQDDPITEHLRLSQGCGWAIMMDVARGPSHPDEIEDPTDARVAGARRATFRGWPYEGKRGWGCKTEKMVEAGWYYCPMEGSEDFVSCPYCKLSLDGWEPKDDPFDEHYRRSQDCAFFYFARPKKTGRGARAKKATRSAKRTASVEPEPRPAPTPAPAAAFASASEPEPEPQPERSQPTGRKSKTTKKAITKKSRLTKAAGIGIAAEETAVDAPPVTTETSPAAEAETALPGESWEQHQSENEQLHPQPLTQSPRRSISPEIPSSPSQNDPYDDEILPEADSDHNMDQAPAEPAQHSKSEEDQARGGNPDYERGPQSADSRVMSDSPVRHGSRSPDSPSPPPHEADAIEVDPPERIQYPHISPPSAGINNSQELGRGQEQGQAQVEEEQEPEVEQRPDREQPQSQADELPQAPSPSPHRTVPVLDMDSREMREARAQSRDSHPPAHAAPLPEPDTRLESRPAQSQSLQSGLSDDVQPAQSQTRLASLPVLGGRIRTVTPWTEADVDDVLAPQSDEGPASTTVDEHAAWLDALLSAKTELDEREKAMTVEEWIRGTAAAAERKLIGECERLISVFEREGARAMQSLEGVECID
ncbi:hypothetical protein KEM52_006337 [Ascosphaera acerosa]|nr:hypothetical protein KEM52_006337 [Ascosphaera acerosa]